MLNNSKLRTFISGSGLRVSTTDIIEIKKMKSCGWREVKQTKTIFAKGLVDGKNYLN